MLKVKKRIEQLAEDGAHILIPILKQNKWATPPTLDQVKKEIIQVLTKCKTGDKEPYIMFVGGRIVVEKLLDKNKDIDMSIKLEIYEGQKIDADWEILPLDK